MSPLTPIQARQVVEAWRQGRPPGIGLHTVTTGVPPEFSFNQDFQLLGADQGMGKSHVLAWWQESFLQNGWAVSLVNPTSSPEPSLWTLLISHLMISPGDKPGIKRLFERVKACIDNNEQPPGDEQFWFELSGYHRWQNSGILESDGLFMALRAWLTQEPHAQSRVEDWLANPTLYVGRESQLYRELVWDLRDYFPTPFYTAVECIIQLSWGWTRDIGLLLRATGCKGWIWLWDDLTPDCLLELKSVSTSHESGAAFIMGSVPANFKDKLTQSLLQKHKWEFDFSWLDQVSLLCIPALDAKMAQALVGMVTDIYQIAYGFYDLPVPILCAQNHSIRQLLQTQVQLLDRLHE